MARSNSLNFNRFSKYNFDFISLEEVILLEFFIYHHQKKSIDMIVANRIEHETGMRRSKQERAIQQLEEKGILNIERNPNRVFFTINTAKIVELTSKLIQKKGNKFSVQYFQFVHNPDKFKKKKVAKVIIEDGKEIEKVIPEKPEKASKKSKKATEPTPIKQFSLFD